MHTTNQTEMDEEYVPRSIILAVDFGILDKLILCNGFLDGLDGGKVVMDAVLFTGSWGTRRVADRETAVCLI